MGDGASETEVRFWLGEGVYVRDTTELTVTYPGTREPVVAPNLGGAFRPVIKIAFERDPYCEDSLRPRDTHFL